MAYENESNKCKASGMTRRRFVKLGAATGAVVALAGLSACGAGSNASASSAAANSASASAMASSAATSDQSVASVASGASAAFGSSGASGSPESTSAASSAAASGSEPLVYFVRSVDTQALAAVFAALGKGLSGNVGVKLSSGEPGGNHYLQPSLIEGLVHDVKGTIVECNTAYGG
ncbi:MAG: twin-arginine translocation signal domain-containing protein, partial [Eggerthellaceae bacterium]|nr:twin-arginine translocation signal domain-containing protein [Eggerthellaceae bacterium]